jgi:two-component system, LytTR family, response regulator LytT
MKIVIIEDEKLTAKDLAKTILAVDDDIEIVAILHSVEEAVAFFATNPALDLIFSDIQLGDGLSFEIFEKVKNNVPIIFCTAFNEYALEAFKATSIDYLLKPFSRTTVEKALDKYHQLKETLNAQKENQSDILSLLKNQLYPAKSVSIIIQHGDKIIPLESEKIAFFYIEDNYVFAYTFDLKKHVLTQKLDALESTFSPNFFRANRQYLVNRKAIKDATHHFNRKILINLTVPFQEQIIVGKLKVTPFLEWLAYS